MHLLASVNSGSTTTSIYRLAAEDNTREATITITAPAPAKQPFRTVEFGSCKELRAVSNAALSVGGQLAEPETLLYFATVYDPQVAPDGSQHFTVHWAPSVGGRSLSEALATGLFPAGLTDEEQARAIESIIVEFIEQRYI